MDASPFHEKDLDHDAEEFIESWAFEFPIHDPIILVVHLATGTTSGDLVAQAVHHHFEYRARLNRLEFRRLMEEGRKCLVIGLVFLAVCLTISELVIGTRWGAVSGLFREGLTIAGWVAMWRPLEIYLYSWWPLRHRGKIFEKLSVMPVEVRENVA